MLPMILVLLLYFLLRVLTIPLKRYRYATLCRNFRSYATWRPIKWIPVKVVYQGFRYILKVREIDERGVFQIMEGYEEREKALLRRLRPIRTAIDVGANIGAYTFFLAKLCSRVVALEPDPRSWNILARNISLNRIDNVMVIPYAASSSYRKVILELRDSGTTRIIHGNAEKDIPLRGNVLLVTAVPLDEVIRLLALRDVDFVKIDVEGHEVQVLKGATKLLKVMRPIVLVEVWRENILSVLKLLGSLRYKLIDLHPTKVKIAKNLLAVPEERIEELSSTINTIAP